jgi:prophage endopeptidase
MSLRSTLIGSLIALCLGLGTGYAVRSYMAQKDALAHQASEQQAALDADATYLAKLSTRDAAVKDLQNQLTQLDTEKTDALNAAIQTNDSLRGDLAVAQRMRLTGTTCPTWPATVREAGSASSVGHDTWVGLSAQTRYAVFDLRAGIVSDRAKLDYLQRYIRQVGLSPPAQ